MMGDGGISERQITVTVHISDDREYANYVAGLISGLFDVPVSRYYLERKNVIAVVVSRTELVDFCHKKLGLPIGDKLANHFDIPSWIKKALDTGRPVFAG